MAELIATKQIEKDFGGDNLQNFTETTQNIATTSGSADIDVLLATQHVFTTAFTGALTFNFINLPAVGTWISGVVEVVKPAGQTLSFAAPAGWTVTAPGGTAPTLAAGGSFTYRIVHDQLGGGEIRIFDSGQDYQAV